MCAKSNEYEHQEQVALIGMVEQAQFKWPCLNVLYAIPNGGKRNKLVAVKLKAEGLKKGVPDLCLPVARCGYHGLYIEMKYGKNKPTAEQSWWRDRLIEEGYCHGVCYDRHEAFNLILNYIEGGKGNEL